MWCVHEAYTQDEEADFVGRQVLDLERRENIKAGSCAVMYRINAQSRALEEACLRLGIKYRIIGGVQFYRRREIRDVMAYLCVLQNPQDDVNLARAINTPPRGIGDKTIQELTRWALGQRISVFESIKLIAQARAAAFPCPAPLAPRAYTAVARFGDLMIRMEELKDKLPVSDLIELLVSEAGLEAHIRRVDTNPEERMENIQEFISLATSYESESPENDLASFLERASLVSDVDNYEEYYAAPGQGAGVSGGFHSGAGGGAVTPQPIYGQQRRPGGRAAALLRGNHPSQGTPLLIASFSEGYVGTGVAHPAIQVPGRNPGKAAFLCPCASQCTFNRPFRENIL